MFLALILVIQFSPVSAATKVDNNKEKTFFKIYTQAKENRLISLASDNTIIIDKSIYMIYFPKNDIDIFIGSIESGNFLVKKGIGYYDDQLDFKCYSVDVIQENAHNKKATIYTNDNIIPLTSDYPDLYAYTVAQQNKQEILDIYNNLLNSPDPDTRAGAYSFTVGYWVGCVAPGGPWDYKVGDLGPYDRMWTMHLKYNSLIYANAEWFGNFNYGLTGSVLFSESVLLEGSMAASIATMRAGDDATDISAIKRGYSER